MRYRVRAVREPTRRELANTPLRLLQQSPLFAVVSCVALLSGCFVRGGGTSISSIGSSYSPVVSFSARVHVTDSVHVQLNRVRVLSPGQVFVGMGAVTGAIEMQALVVTANPDADLSKAATASTIDRNGTRKPWLERAASGGVRLADSLFMGVEQTTGPLRFTILVPANADLSASWLVFRITGPSVATPARMADGTITPMFAMPAIRVFACSAKNLNGKVDAARQRLMNEAYSAEC